MWFAALGTPQQNPWFIHLCVRLLQGSPEVLRLLGSNPFPDAPPRYIRAVFTSITSTTPTLWRQQGGWWRRESPGIYLPALVVARLGGAISPAK